MRVLDAFGHQRATWSGQVISSPRGPSRGPFMTHLLPGGGVPQVHTARRPVPPRLPHFATPWSVRYLAAVAAGAYPLRRPPDVWSPGAPAAGPVLLACCKWHPHGLARRLPSLGAGAWRSAPLLPWRVQCPDPVCAALAAGSGELGPVSGVVPSPFPPSRPAFRALCVAGRPVWVSLILARWYAIPCSLCVPRGRSGCPSGLPRMTFVCACARALAASAPPHLPGFVWRAHLARSRCWTLVGRFHAARAPPRFPPRSCAPIGLLGGGGGGPVSPYLAWGCALSVGRVRAWGPVTNPTTRTLAGWLCTLWGRREGARGGRLVPGCGASGVERSPTPDHSSFQACGRGPLPTGCGCGGSGPETRHQRYSARSCKLALRAVGAARGRPGGGSSCPGVGRPGLSSPPPPTTCPFVLAPGAQYPLAVGAGGAGVGTPQQPQSTRSCELALRVVGAA